MPSVLLEVLASTYESLTVTAEVASSSLVVPAIFSKHRSSLVAKRSGQALGTRSFAHDARRIVQLHSAANYESTGSLNRNPGYPPRFLSVQTQVRMIPLLTNSLVFDCLNTKVLKSLETILHGFEFFGGVPLTIQDLAYDKKGILGAVCKRRVARVLLVSQM